MILYSSRINFLLLVIFVFATIQIFAAAGDFDLVFGGSGIVLTDIDSSDSIRDLAVQTDGKIIAVGVSFQSSTSLIRGVILRYRPNGSVDTTFGTNGTVLIPSVFLEASALQTNGKIVVAGYIGTSPNFDFYIARLNPDGTFDATFNGTGELVLDLRASSDVASSVKIQSDGKILVGGGSATDFAVVRLNANGSLDTTFDGDGKVYTTLQQNAAIRNLALQTDGKILAVGEAFTINTSTGNPDGSFATVRYNPNGSLDTTFNNTGSAFTQFVSNGLPGGTIANTPNTVMIRANGKILVAGTTGSCCGPQPLRQVALIQYNADGSLDSSFGNGGKTQKSFASFPMTGARDAAIDVDDKIVIAGGVGNAGSVRAIVGRFNANGTPDTSFSNDGWNTIESPNGIFTDGSALSIQPDGKIIIGGYRSGSGTSQDFLVARFKTFCTTTCAGGRYETADFDGDGRTDLSIFRSGVWFIKPSAATDPNSYYTQPLGAAGDRLIPEDYDGDGRTDIAVWRENLSTNQSYFYILQSSNNVTRIYQFGNTGDDPRAVGDWDGDGRADLALYRRAAQSLFYYIPSSALVANYTVIPWGIAEDEFVRGDFDGDNKQDAAVFRPSSGVWYILQSSNAQPAYTQWGLANDKLVPSDYDGDGKTDIAVFRDGVWYVFQSSNLQPRYQYWGLGSDRIVAGDYDGDGRTDFAVWRAGIYYVLSNSTLQATYYYFGLADDIPAASAFVR